MFLLRDSLPGGGPLQKQTLLCRSAVLLAGAFSLTEIRQNFCKIKKQITRETGYLHNYSACSLSAAKYRQNGTANQQARKSA